MAKQAANFKRNNKYSGGHTRSYAEQLLSLGQVADYVSDAWL